jgi:hypothetical protein
MDYSADLGPAMEASANRERTRALQVKVESLEREIDELKEIIRNLIPTQ